MKADHYDTFAESYARENESGLFNAYYARPAIIELAGDVSGRSILDAGCGAGPLSAVLRDRGAQITAFDSSPEMVALAQRRLGTDARVLLADLTAPLPFGTGEFDDVVASLVLHYFEDWSGPLAELHRVLKPGGRLILSVNHPVIRPVVYPEADYFATSPYTEEYTFDGHTASLTFWHRPLHAMTDAFTRAGFAISVISEPPYSPETPRELLPPDLGDRTSFLCFLFFVLEARPVG
ncbi:Methyltransferase type 11 [Kribbella flavida DSM 17836]|uniref:Methyltransferase type 11 n=1 Tax=Kribbella flavida (strain DSM 17836 / JCM 10339 / NBRC 14399) TaxID=479435 RepID=D2PMP3_KRIFD|nr:class I SAM-dependent methyltransferase [Kribbella flavida]ADB32595.1 Methyltransferase type 11 [Kribbella flavida DSM 17836]